MIFYVGSLRWELVTEIDFNDGGCKNFIRNFKLLCSTKQSVTMSRAVVTIHTVSAGLKTRNFFFFPFNLLYLYVSSDNQSKSGASLHTIRAV